jgi:hypothetical protein
MFDVPLAILLMKIQASLVRTGQSQVPSISLPNRLKD